jgi:reversibly glycosylated polypeptide/UDP-arabinopyranose mutase
LPHFGPDDEPIVVEDSPGKTIDAATKHHYSHQEIGELLGDAAWIISKRDSAIRCFGFLMAWFGEYDLVVTLDDDCLPTECFASRTIGQAYREAMCYRRWQESIPGMRTRGIPYRDLGSVQSSLHMGLWSNVPDLDAIGELYTIGSGKSSGGFAPPGGRRIVNDRQFFPMCGMNLAFRRELIPAMYFPLMGEGQRFGRFDDIWAGLIAQRICRHLRLPMSIGEPHIEHCRASDPFVNLKKEAPGIEAHEQLWRIVDECDLNGSDALDCVQEISSHLCSQSDEYVINLGEALAVWASLLSDESRLRFPSWRRMPVAVPSNANGHPEFAATGKP